MTRAAGDATGPQCEPHFGFTKMGHAVHARISDYHPAPVSRYDRWNRAIALWITKNVGTMTCFWVFTLVALLSLPATLHLAGFHFNSLYAIIPAFFLTIGWIYVIQWLAQSYAQLVLLPALMVGQNLQNVAADARAAKTFEDVERVIDLLRLDTEGGLRDLYEKLHAEMQAPTVAGGGVP